jgi:uncharacterized protein YydD (DUF2326 family)
MRLIELTANNASFRTVRFNETGLTLVVGKKSDPTDTSREHSTNGVGKSLLLYLVSFCLGSKANKALHQKLPAWEFTLKFELDGNRHTVTRSTGTQNSVTLDGDAVSLTQYTEDFLGKQLFGLSEPRMKYLTFRSLIGLFLRVGKPAYMAEDQISDRETPFARQLRACYLLGLDEKLANKKRELKEELDRLEKLRKQFETDTVLRDYLQGDRNIDLELRDLLEQIDTLQRQAAQFQVADNYEQIAADAEETRRIWQRSRNSLNSLQSSQRQIEASLAEQPDVSVDDVREMYERAQVQLPEAVRKRLDEVTAFHQELVESRSRRLIREKHDIERRIEELTVEISHLDEKKDKYYKFLGTHGALQEYEALHNRLSDCQRRADRLREFQRMEEDCQRRSQQTKLQMSQENIRATEFLTAAKPLTDEINDRFRSMARRMWPNHTCGLVMHNNEGENKVRFDIDSRIQGDASDGIGESKIFCFDMTVLLGRKNHNMRFLMHDNRLYQGVDPRQCAELFEIADELCRASGCQYIASLNEDKLTAIRANMEDPLRFDPLFRQNTVLELTDDADEGKLLGITVDLQYDNPMNREE